MSTWTLQELTSIHDLLHKTIFVIYIFCILIFILSAFEAYSLPELIASGLAMEISLCYLVFCSAMLQLAKGLEEGNGVAGVNCDSASSPQ